MPNPPAESQEPSLYQTSSAYDTGAVSQAADKCKGWLQAAEE